MFEILRVSKSGYYDWKKRKECRRSREDRMYLRAIVQIFRESNKTYGRPRIHKELKNRGINIGKGRVEKLMKKAGIKPETQKMFRVNTTDSNHRMPVSANLLKRVFQVARPNQVWVTDITHVRTRRGFVYLCLVMDLYSRKVVGWSLEPHMRTSMVCAAMKMALRSRIVKPWKLIFHSDRGPQYASKEFRELLRKHKVISSMSRRGECLDNACAESLNGTIKKELIHRREFENYLDARQAILLYIEGFYNRRRLHSFLDFMSPDDFEMKNDAA